MTPRKSLMASLTVGALLLPAAAHARPACGVDDPCPTPTPVQPVAATGTFNGGKFKNVQVHAAADSKSAVVRKVRSGKKAFIVCQTTGTTVTGPYGTSAIWDKLQKGGYASDTRIYTGSDSTVAPDCNAPTTPAPTANDPFTYDDPGPWRGGAGCSGGYTAGATALKGWLQKHFAYTSSIGGYSCRQNTANPAQTSLHGEGRALDWMASAYNAAQKKTVERFIAKVSAHDYKLARAMGIQEMIFNRKIWTATYHDQGFRAYTGPVPHTDHIHIGLNRAGAAKQTSFYAR